MRRRPWLLLLLAAPTWAAELPPVYELELRWVEWGRGSGGLSTAQPPTDGLSTSAPGIPTLGPGLRVQAGATAEWELEHPGAGWQWLQLRQGGARIQWNAAQPQPWRLRFTPTPRGQAVQLALEFQQPEGPGGRQFWRSQLTLRPDHWVVLARSGMAQPRLPPGALSTQALGPQRELQIRLRQILDPSE